MGKMDTTKTLFLCSCFSAASRGGDSGLGSEFGMDLSVDENMDYDFDDEYVA